jgi:uncharacterized membrane protein
LLRQTVCFIFQIAGSHNRPDMSFLRFLALLALALWIGGLVTLGAITASTLFDVLEARDPATGRDLAAAAFGAIFRRFHYVSWGAGLVLLASLGARAALGPRPLRFGLRMWISAGMLAASVASVFLVAPRIERIRATTNGPVANLPEDDPRRIEFGRWHKLSTSLMALTIAAGVGLMWTEMKDGH